MWYFSWILGLGFAIFYTLLGLPIARLAEHRNRARIVAVSTAIFSAFVCLCSTSRSFAQILLYRVGVGAGVPGAGGGAGFGRADAAALTLGISGDLGDNPPGKTSTST